MSATRFLVRALGGILSALNRPVGKRRFSRAFHTAPSPVCIEFGAWKTERPGWIATDVSWRCRNYLDVTRRWPIPDDSVDFLFSDNVIEHLTLDQARTALKEAHRVLRQGGVIRIVTPDVSELVRLYLAGPESAASLRAELAQEGYLVAHQVDLLRFAFQDDGHHKGYLWDRDSLAVELRSSGFTSVEFHEPAQSRFQRLTNLDRRVGIPLGDAMLAVEAVKDR